MPKRKLQKAKSKFNFSRFFFILGLFLITSSLIWSLYEKTVLSFDNIPNQPELITQTKSTPLNLSIPSQKIDLPIIESEIKGSNWQINPTGASHLRSSANPGEPGNIIIYGHNKTALLGKITNLKKGDLINLTDSKATIHTYKITQTLTVTPSDIWVLKSKGTEELTLYTCTGLFDSKRFIIKASPISNTQ